MTREELIKCLELLKEQARNSGANTFVWDISVDSFIFVINMAIKALGQEPILDKIRAEISDFEEEVFNRPNTDYSDYAAIRHCLEIIDKYKAERSEE